jgi:streptomycin 6-kinase
VSADRVEVPAELARIQTRYGGAAGRAWLATLPAAAATFLDLWGLTRDGPAMHGMGGLVLPVRTGDGTPAVLKLRPRNDEPGEGPALRVWNGDGAVLLLREDPDTWTLLLERLDAGTDLRSVEEQEAVRVIGGLLARLHRHPPPPGLPRLADIAATMVADAPAAAASIGDGPVVRRWADLLAEILPDGAGDTLLHWDLHYENVLAGVREPWLAIDPVPLVGDPAFDLMPALDNRWEEILAAADPSAAVRRRFDALVEILGLDRGRAAVWTVARALQNTLWDIEDGKGAVDPKQRAIADALAVRFSA